MIPDNDCRSSDRTILYQVSHKQIANDPGLLAVSACSHMANKPAAISSAIDSWRTFGAGWIDFVDRLTYQFEGGKAPVGDDPFVAGWILAARLPQYQIAEGTRHLFQELMELVLPEETCFCTFRGVPITHKNNVQFTATVILPMFSPKSRGMDFPIIPGEFC